jgi:hypothetical protein
MWTSSRQSYCKIRPRIESRGRQNIQIDTPHAICAIKYEIRSLRVRFRVPNDLRQNHGMLGVNLQVFERSKHVSVTRNTIRPFVDKFLAEQLQNEAQNRV